MKKFFLYIPLIMLAAAIAGCSREEIKPLTGGTLELTASVPYFDIETKAGEEFTDEVTAYPLAGTALAADPVLQNYAASGSYFFTIPGGTDNIVFTTVEAAPTAYTASMDFVNGSISVSAAEGQPVGRDLIFGWLQNYSAGQTQATTDLRRASARLNISLKAIYGVDTVSNLTSTFQSAEVSVSGMHTSAVLEYQTLKYSYSGEGNVAFPLNQDENGVYAARIMTLPSTGTTTPVLTLTLTTPDGSVRSYSSPLPSGISTNYSYNMNLLLSWDNASADFTFSDIQMNTLEMDGIPSQSFDFITFNKNILTFGQKRGYNHDIEVTESRLGTWTAHIPTEVLEYFSISNIDNGATASIETPIVYGEEGDIIRINTIQDNNTGEYLHFSIPFSSSIDGETFTYNLTLIQTDGSTQSITWESLTYHSVYTYDNYDYFLSFKTDGTIDTLDDNPYGGYPLGRYMIIGDLISIFRVDDASLSELTFNNCQTLESVEIYNCSATISGIDLSNSSEVLNNLIINLKGDTYIENLDLTNNSYLNNISIDIPSLKSILLPEQKETLRKLSIINSKITQLDAHGYKNLYEVYLSNSYDLTYLNLSNCPSIETVNFNNNLSNLNNLNKIDITGCLSLKNLYINADFPLESLDFTGCEFIDNIEIMNNSTLSSIILPDARDLSRLKINNLSALTSLELSGSTIDCLEISNCSLLPLEEYLDGSVSLRSIRLNGHSNLAALDISSTTLEELYLEYCSSLTSLNVAEGNRLKKVSLNSNTSLKFINTNLNAASTLEELRIESCSQSSDGSIPRDSIDLSGYSALRLVSIKYCYYYTYGASFEGCTSLTDLRLQSNHQIENLNISGCTSLRTMDLYDNNLDSAALTSVLKSLPDLNGTSGGQYCIRHNLPEDNNYSSIQTGIDSAADHGWTLSEEMLPDLDFSFNYN